jgi:phosphoribosylanthranilate isomerase
LHGPETPHRVEAIRAEAGVAILKALPIGTADDLAAIAEFADIADRVLLDAKAPKQADRPGGHGVVFDWTLLKGLDPSVAFMLSGGLTPDNVAEAVKTVKPFGVDVSSGVETAPGRKDAGMIRAFIAAARAS